MLVIMKIRIIFPRYPKKCSLPLNSRGEHSLFPQAFQSASADIVFVLRQGLSSWSFCYKLTVCNQCHSEAVRHPVDDLNSYINHDYVSELMCHWTTYISSIVTTSQLIRNTVKIHLLSSVQSQPELKIKIIKHTCCAVLYVRLVVN